jgi:hypothetical protein
MTVQEERPRPNPGSSQALALGCTCPVLDNNHGEYPPFPPDSWWINGSCPMHSPGLEREDRRV